jgi:glycerol-3-phosphate cytidylyltransferase
MGLTLYTGGTFDLFHAGHVEFLRQCSMIAKKVIVSLNTDEFIEEYKGKPPVMSYWERQEVLRACVWVDDVVPNTGNADSKPAILEAKADIVAIGSDWARKDYYKQMQFTQDWLDEHNICLLYIPYTLGISSTDIKNRLSKR